MKEDIRTTVVRRAPMLLMLMVLLLLMLAVLAFMVIDARNALDYQLKAIISLAQQCRM